MAVEIVPNPSSASWVDESDDEIEQIDEQTDEEEDHIIRAKWQMDGATTLDEAIQKLQHFIEYLDALKKEGWELRQPIDDDYGFIYKRQ